MLFALLQFGGTVQVSHEHPIASISMITAMLTFFFGIVIVPALALLGGLPLLSADVRRSKVLRSLCIATLCLPVVLILNLVGWFAFFPLEAHADILARSHAVQQATTREGVPIPAGSKVTEPRQGNDDFYVKLAAPTVADGLRWTGLLNVNPIGPYRSLEGTLAGSYTIHGIACGPGPALVNYAKLRCVLAQSTVLHGFRFAAGHPLEFDYDEHGEVGEISNGTLADPFPYGGVTWPAGVVISPLTAPLAAFQKGPADKPEQYIDICVPAGMEAVYKGVTLHGPADIEFNPGSASVTNGCGAALDAAYKEYGSLRMPGGAVHRSGLVPYDSNTWQWHDEEQPAEHVDGRFSTGADPFGFGDVVR
ncbi:hypothetical protein [Terriglobus sp.]|uniref:hypothetical protein n=1 Tax=Terriglobus sp. TaxID=1889013 RepID=UPI003B00B905